MSAVQINLFCLPGDVTETGRPRVRMIVVYPDGEWTFEGHNFWCELVDWLNSDTPSATAYILDNRLPYEIRWITPPQEGQP